MGKIGCGYGSEWHLLRYLGYHRDFLEKEILLKTGGDRITWLDFNFSNKNESIERDKEWKGLDFLDKDTKRRWKDWWPQRGNVQNWDAVGKIHFGDSFEWLLVEAKAHINEIKSSCGAKPEGGRDKIRSNLAETKESFTSDDIPVENWLAPYYQFCNRLAVLHFLQKNCNPKVPVRLLMLYFYGDKAPSTDCPQSPKEWKTELTPMYDWVGLDKKSELSERIHTVFLSVNPKTNS